MKTQTRTNHAGASPGKRTGSRLAKALRGDSGSAVLELALIVPIFTLMLVGAAEFGRLCYDSAEVKNAAYAGAAYGAQSRTTASNTSYIQTAATSDGANLTGMSVSSATSCVCSSGTTITCSNAATLCVAPNRIKEYVQVNTSVTVSSIFEYPGIPTSFVMSGQAILPVEK